MEVLVVRDGLTLKCVVLINYSFGLRVISDAGVPASSLNPRTASLELELCKVCPLPKAAAAAKSLQSCPTLCDPIDGSPPGSPVPGILQAKTLEWVSISFSNV